MGSTSDTSCEIDIQETKGEKKEVEQRDKRPWDKNFEKPGSQPRKKIRLDTTQHSKPNMTAIQSPSADCIEIDCTKAKTSSPVHGFSFDQYHEPTEKDVVFGKGRFIQNLAGNVRLRKLIKSHFDQYESADCPQDKTLMAMRLVVDIKESGGKFLKEDTSAPGKYVEVSSITAREKIAATFHSHRRRSKQSKMEATANESKQMAFTTSTEPSRTSPISLPVREATSTDRVRPFPGPSNVMELGLGSQGKLFGSSPVYTSSLLQHGLNMLPRRRAVDLSREMMSRISRHSATEIPLKGSYVPVHSDRVIMEQCANAASRDTMSQQPRSNHRKVCSGSLSPDLQEDMQQPPGNKRRENSLTSRVFAGPVAKNSQGRLLLAPSSDSKITHVRSSRSSQSSPQRMSSSSPKGNSSRRLSPNTRAIHTGTVTESSFETSTEHPSYCTSQEALQAQLYREMGLPGF